MNVPVKEFENRLIFDEFMSKT